MYISKYIYIYIYFFSSIYRYMLIYLNLWLIYLCIYRSIPPSTHACIQASVHPSMCTLSIDQFPIDFPPGTPSHCCPNVVGDPAHRPGTHWGSRGVPPWWVMEPKKKVIQPPFIGVLYVFKDVFLGFKWLYIVWYSIGVRGVGLSQSKEELFGGFSVVRWGCKTTDHWSINWYIYI